jgi:hypothetical protein
MDVAKVLRDLEPSGFRDLAGTRASARIPVSRALVNRAVADALRGTSAPIRAIDVQPRPGDRFDVMITVTWPFVPALTMAVGVERQPRFPESPLLVLRWSLLGGVGAIASRFVSSLDRLPPGVRLDGDRLVIDIPAALRGRGAATALLPFVTALEIHTSNDTVIIETALEIPAP